MPTTFRGWTMSNQSVVNAKEPEVSHAHRPMVLSFSGQADRTEERWSPREDATLAKENPSLNPGRRALFEQVVLPHLDSAYNLARWLTGNDHNAEDVVQDTYLRAFEFFGSFRGGNGRPWLLTIVRRGCYDWLRRNRSHQPLAVFDEELHSDHDDSDDPAELLLRQEDREMLRKALDDLPVEFREVLILRELEGLSYKEIAAITDLPPGTIMSRLARARERLRRGLVKHLREGA
jgi:RNA polymerase sigma factor (sigma-70 family)